LRFVHQLPDQLRLPGSTKDWERVFVNLFLNAAQVMQKPGRIEISAVHAANSIRIIISDNGPGIPPAILGNVFSPNVSTKRLPAGRSGLGLHIVSSIVEKHAGQISASNRERGTGAVFTISLPAPLF
jgi:signal transduction histidine kinase